jgi:hypothetical protein
MNDHLGALSGDEDHELQEVPRSVGTDDEPPVRILTDVFDRQGVLDGVAHVVIEHPVAAGR